MNSFLDTLKNRRSLYALDKNISISHERVRHIVEHALMYTPSAFNSQSARVVILLNRPHEFVWDAAKDILRQHIPEEAFAKTAQKLDAFRAGAGTLLFFDDATVIRGLQSKFPLYQDNFPIWAHQANGMLQSNIWSALSEEGVGASLQHYNPLIDDAVMAEFELDAAWSLVAQMPFGNPVSSPAEKDFVPLSERLRMFS